MGHLITVEELAGLIAASSVRLVDVRWRLDRPDGREDHAAGHIPGAVYADLETQLAGPGAPEDGRHPLPSAGRLQEAARSWGIRTGDTVVVYDDLGGLSAARAWWLLRHAGHEDVRVLDGGLAAWREAGHPLETGEHRPAPGDVELAYGALSVIDADAAGSLPEAGLLLDVRAPERYRGEHEPVDPIAGHIPGAVNAPTGENLDASGRFLAPELLRQRFEALGVRPGVPVGSYCGSGVTAAHTVLALGVAGYEAALFPGSWSQWSNEPGRPVARGSQPHG